VAAAVPGTTVSINTNAPPDKRSYMVDFSLFKQVAPDHQPRVTLNQAIHELIEGMQRMNFKDADFRTSHFMRLKVLDSHIESKRLSHELRWAPITA
jgi:UDP-glucose 4-epimerase